MKNHVARTLCLSSVLVVSGAVVSGAENISKTPAKTTVRRPTPAVKAATSKAATPPRSPVPEFVAVKPDNNFVLPRIVLQYDPATETGYDWEKLKDLNFYQLSGANATVVHTVRYLQEAVQRMTDKELQVTSGNDLTHGIVLITLKGAPAQIKNDPEVQQALRNTGKDSYNANEAFVKCIK